MVRNSCASFLDVTHTPKMNVLFRAPNESKLTGFLPQQTLASYRKLERQKVRCSAWLGDMWLASTVNGKIVVFPEHVYINKANFLQPN